MCEITDIEQIIQLLEIRLEQMKFQIDQLKKQVGMTKAQNPSSTSKGGKQ
jgi:hypothetical protein